ncbi:hypothetical protein EDB87DRAFT_1687921 [Lactarius vividus]|nr:hypothetical protein EDB87DRAFT_1687921 [Lactarius vividus]
MSDELWQSLLSEDVEGGLPSFAPPPQDAPESFEKDLEEYLEEIDSADVDPNFSTSLDDPFHIFRDFTPSPGLASPPGSTYTTESSEDPATSDYSYMTYSTSSCPAPPFDGFGSQLNAVDPKHNMFSPIRPRFLDFDPFGHQLSLSLFTDVYVVGAQSDDGPYRSSVGISPHILSSALQSPPPSYSADPPICAASATEIRTIGPIREKYVCPHCGHRSARKHNLKTHMETHNPNRERPFVCPEIECGQPFTRKHDLKRHLESMHGGRAK